MKGNLLALNQAVILWGSTLYVGVLWALRFFWFPTWHHLTVANYYDQFIPQTQAATHFFTYWVPITLLCLCVMAWSERKTRLRWVPWAGLLLLGISTYVGTQHIIPINKFLATHITDQAVLTDRLEHWMSLNTIRWVTETLAWLVMMYYFIAKGRLPERILEDLA
jgi:hypothetical protein